MQAHVCPEREGGEQGRTEPGLCTRSDGVCGHKHSVQPVGLHEAADLLHSSVQTGHVLPVAPDEVFPSQVDGKVGAPQRGAQLDLAEEDGTCQDGPTSRVRCWHSGHAEGTRVPHSASCPRVCLRNSQVDRMFSKAVK